MAPNLPPEKQFLRGRSMCSWASAFYFIESAITAGLCMTNMGGTGDVAVLSAAKRMQLMPSPVSPRASAAR